MKIDFGKEHLSEVIQFSGYFDFKKIYEFVAAWFKRREYEFHEKSYKRKKAEIELSWYAERAVNEYIMYTIKIAVHLYGDGNGPTPVDEVEVIKDGVKRRMMHGRIHIIISGVIESDYKDLYGNTQWDKTPFLRTLQKVFEKSVLKQEIYAKYLDPFYYEVLELFEDIKKQFEMYGIGSFY